ncbi:hypothetical protein ACFC1B_26675 [Streptomyces xiamenensis]|uniref:hypothetical protein n=1 Tax=Streptomyces xiamenensis TaxID=408015 RepID=UPI0035D9C834
MSLTPERLEQVRAQHAAGLLTNTAAELLAEIDRQAKEIDRLAADRHHWMTQYYEESRTYWDAELPPGGECCAVCGQPVESEPCPDHHPATVADRLTAEVEQLRQDRPARADEPLTLRWSVQDIAFVDDGSVELYLTTTDGQPALLPLSAEQAAALRDDLPGSPTRAEVLEQVAAWLAEVGEHDTAHLLRNVEDLFLAPAPAADGGAR